MIEILSAVTEDNSVKKRGRKSVKENYFDVREEDAVRNFLVAETSEEKNKIYNVWGKTVSNYIRKRQIYYKFKIIRYIRFSLKLFSRFKSINERV